MLGLGLVPGCIALITEVVPHVLAEARLLVAGALAGTHLCLNAGSPVRESLVRVEAQAPGVSVLAIASVVGLEQIRRENVLRWCLGLRLVEWLWRCCVGGRSWRGRREVVLGRRGLLVGRLLLVMRLRWLLERCRLLIVLRLRRMHVLLLLLHKVLQLSASLCWLDWEARVDALLTCRVRAFPKAPLTIIGVKSFAGDVRIALMLQQFLVTRPCRRELVKRQRWRSWSRGRGVLLVH